MTDVGEKSEKILTLGAGRTLFKQGDKGGDLFFIKSGKVELTVRDEETGAEAVVATVGDRSVIGTMSFLEGDPRSATALAKTEVKYVQINQIQRDRLLQQVPSWFRVLVKDLSVSMRRLNETYIKLKADADLLQKKYDSKGSQIEKLEQDLAAEKESAKKADAEWKEKEEKYKKEVKDLKAQLQQAAAKPAK